MGLFTYMGVTEGAVGPGSHIVIAYDGLPLNTTIKIYAKTGATTFQVWPNASGISNSSYGLAVADWHNDPTPGASEDWGTGTSAIYANSSTGPFSGGIDIDGPLNITWDALGGPIASYPAYPAPTIVTADWSDAHPQPFLSWLPVTPNDPHFQVVYSVGRSFTPGGPYSDALGLAGFGGYLSTSFTDAISGTAGYVYYAIAASDAVVSGATTYVTVYRPPPVITPPPPPPTPAVATGPHNHGIVRRRPKPR